YLVIRHGISEKPKVGDPVDPATYEARYHRILERGVPFFPDAAWKDVVFALAIGVVVMGLAVAIGPPQLGPLADPTVVRADPRPDWYFLWYFALLALIPPSIENGFILGFPLLVGLALFFLPFFANRGERHPARRPWAVLIVGVAVISIAILVREGNAEPWSPNFSPEPIPASIVVTLGPSAKNGAAVFERDGCHQCHLIAGTGGQRGPDLTQVGGRLNRAELITRVLNGGNNMPSFAGHLSTGDLNDLIDFLQALR
ncbi:MAG TPA: c-type cytochrome, partial [Chloroflexota bacterium]|nr:c-type cytochrome [Chloroflexota bacterium]